MDERGETRPQKAGRIRDARGRGITQIDPVAMYLLHRHKNGIPHAVLCDSTQQIGIGRLTENRFGVVALVCVLLRLGGGITQLIRVKRMAEKVLDNWSYMGQLVRRGLGHTPTRFQRRVQIR